MIYLDSAATSLHKPPQVAEAVMKALSSFGNPGRGGHGASLDAARTVYAAREKLARLFHADGPQQIAFTQNATQSLNTAIRGLIRPGDHVITTVLEHNSVLRPLCDLESCGAEITILGCDALGRVEPEAFRRALRPNTRAIVCTHASNLTGNMIDIGRVGEIAAGHGVLFIVDASQTAGVFDIDMQAMHIDVLCFTGHKGLLGPQGTGGLALRRGVCIRPLMTGGSGVQSYSRTHPAQMPEALEAGTLNAHAIAGLDAALDYILRVTPAAIRQKEDALFRAFLRGAREIPGLTLYGDVDAAQRCAILSLNVGGYDSQEVSDALYMHYGIAVRSGAHCAPLMHMALGTQEQGAVRFSFSHENTMEDINAALRALRELAQ